MSRAQDQELRRILKRGIRPARAVSPATVLRLATEVQAKRDAPMSDVTNESLLAEAAARGLIGD